MAPGPAFGRSAGARARRPFRIWKGRLEPALDPGLRGPRRVARWRGGEVVKWRGPLLPHFSRVGEGPARTNDLGTIVRAGPSLAPLYRGRRGPSTAGTVAGLPAVLGPLSPHHTRVGEGPARANDLRTIVRAGPSLTPLYRGLAGSGPTQTPVAWGLGPPSAGRPARARAARSVFGRWLNKSVARS